MQRKKPEQLAYYEVLIRRSFETEKYTTLYAKVKSGYLGELRLDREWKDTNMNGLLLHDFTCFNAAHHRHQIDTIFICKHFVLVIEAKNVTGRIDFNPQTRQLIRQFENGKVEPFTSPIDQVKRHQALLEHHFLTFPDNVPVEAAVVITNPNCLIGNTSTEIPMFAVNGLRSIVDELILRHQQVTLNVQQIRDSLKQLYRPHTAQPWRENVPVRTGVLCLQCNGKMRATKNGFKCPKCNHFDRNQDALRRTLHDYRVLNGPSIANQAFRQFAEIESRTTAYEILNRLLPQKKYAGRSSTYFIPPDISQNPTKII